MAKQVPTGNSLKGAAMDSVLTGGTLAAGELGGRALLGGGPTGSLIGGVAAAASESGDTREMMATIAMERFANEVMGVQ